MIDMILSNGVDLPALGFGTFQIPPGKECAKVVKEAIDAGYRMIDTAYSYQNEKSVGEGIRNTGVPREEIFLTTKIYMMGADGYAFAKNAFPKVLERLGVDYIDMYMIHMPFADYYGAWRAMEEFYKQGRIRVLGVCNFSSADLVDFQRNVEIMPQVNQIERHPFYQRWEELKLMQDMGVQPQAWAPFAEGMHGMFQQPVLQAIAQKHRKTVGQVILRWELQTGCSAVVKSVHTERIQENYGIWDFALDQDELEKIRNLDVGHPLMLDTGNPVEVNRCYDFLEKPVVTSLS